MFLTITMYYWEKNNRKDCKRMNARMTWHYSIEKPNRTYLGYPKNNSINISKYCMSQDI